MHHFGEIKLVCINCFSEYVSYIIREERKIIICEPYALTESTVDTVVIDQCRRNWSGWTGHFLALSYTICIRVS